MAGIFAILNMGVPGLGLSDEWVVLAPAFVAWHGGVHARGKNPGTQ